MDGSFNGTFRECLTLEGFRNRVEAKIGIERGGALTPAECKAQFQGRVTQPGGERAGSAILQ